ncbi:MAG: hypothetical protein KDH94_04315, partial [Coxiellaceae bacterium]|nr:hypothetical protein [Coxiellaceae bacterium]
EWRISHFSKQEKITGVLVAFALIAFPTYLFYSYYEHLREDQQSYSFVRLRQALQPIVVAARHMIPSNAKVFVIWQDSKGFEPMVLGYALIPRNINQSPFSFGVPYSASDVWTQKYSVQKLKNAMKSYDYILLAYTDKVFWKTYQSLFPKRHKHQLVEYLICQKSGFDGFGKSGCNTQAENAYLYKNK